MRKLNVSLLFVNIVMAFVIICSVCYSDSADLGYADRISALESKVTKLQSDVGALQMKISSTVSTTSTTSTKASSGAWQNLGNGQSFEPADTDQVSVSSTTHKCHFWKDCQYFNPTSKLTYKDAKAQFADLQLCLLCVKHLVPPATSGNLAPAKASNLTTQGNIKSK